ncbi:DUF3592 domain-containing protein [Streptomyces resistomycificus]|uniref:DUF3592 domain-containing protein n=1 Tax=Streptomyces resistomycificus TaxID=67356 RepID=A0A0L8LDD3_9ACTN|nr:DUF3592 domain-containing protein [Streptomyces resistomycificus]KOG36041.1 hypothetical protein ADK37_14035 [Streptomyces resistomycificus]KUN92380.1 hypothetical protein AQJ84_33390 [Streptomyces resistomycificus]
MQAFFFVMPPLLIIGIVGVAAYAVIRRAQVVSSAWNSGLTAQARCLRAYTTTSGGGNTSVHTTLHHVYEFVTREGRVVRFDEGGGPRTTVEGDIVIVHYAAHHPERATAKAPARGQLAASTGCLLALLGTIAVFCLGFMALALLAFA